MVLPRWSSTWLWGWGEGSRSPSESSHEPGARCPDPVPARRRIGDVAGVQQPGDARPFGGPLAPPPAVSAGRSPVREAPGGGVGSGLSRYRGGLRRPARGWDEGKRSGRAVGPLGPGCPCRRDSGSQGKGVGRCRGLKRCAWAARPSGGLLGSLAPAATGTGPWLPLGRPCGQLG